MKEKLQQAFNYAAKQIRRVPSSEFQSVVDDIKHTFRPDLHPDYDLTAKAKRLIAQGRVRYNGKVSETLID